MTDFMKSKIEWQSNIYKTFQNSSKNLAQYNILQQADNDILKIIRSPDINKVYGHDDISVRMVKICDDSIKKPLSIIYKNCITTGIYPNAWKKSNIVPVHKKGDKQLHTSFTSSYFW